MLYNLKVVEADFFFMLIKWRYNFVIWYPCYYTSWSNFLRDGGIVETEINGRISSTITFTLEDNLSGFTRH